METNCPGGPVERLVGRLRVAATKLGRSDEWEDLRDDLHHAAAEIERLRAAEKYTGCGHGRLYSEPCVDCEIVGLHEQHRDAARTIARVRNRLRELGAPMPGFTSGGRRAGVAAAQQCAAAIRAGAKEPSDD